MELRKAPLWAPPDVPTRESFGVPIAGPVTIRRVPNLSWTLVDVVRYLWPVALTSGLVYLRIRRDRRDLVLQCALGIGVGLTLAAGSSIGVWILVGGWGPAAPEAFGIIGLVGGLVFGIASFTHSRCREV